MMRFRFRRDEERYFSLLAETREFEERSSSEQWVTLRNRAKLDEMILLEGIRQGAAAAALATLVRDAGGPDYTGLKAYQLHSMVYGSADTPLRDAELALMKRHGIDISEHAGSFLDEKPMLFAPESIREGSRLLFDDEPLVDDDGDDASLLDAVEREQSPAPSPDDVSAERSFAGRPLYHESDFMPEHPVHSPQIVETIRDHVSASSKDWTTWRDMVIDLQSKSHMNAALIDIVLSTPIGRSMLSQCGVHLSPGASLDLCGNG
jgi:hypothetical protein